MSGDLRRAIPSVDRVTRTPGFELLVERFGRDRAVGAVRAALEEARRAILALPHQEGGEVPAGEPEPHLVRARALLEGAEVRSLRPVVNATGVVLHTNLGRAPLAREAIEAMLAAAAGYSNLEFDLDRGVRGSRYVHCVELLRACTGAEDALVVNNAAAGLVLALNTVALGRGVVVSRGELVEIGGGFRIPEILGRAGAELVEVGSTNRTRLADYREPLEGGIASAILKVHRSNFRITGFAAETSLEELAELARAHGVPVVHDLGSGLLIAPERLGLPPEPTVDASLRAGADLVVFSGDKLLGGPQAGIILGRAPLLSRLRANPLCRALRVDKTTLAALEATLRLYLHPERALTEIPVLRMLGSRPEELRLRAERLSAALVGRGVPCAARETVGEVGGGTFPGVELPSWCVEVTGDGQRLAERLRAGRTPVVGRIVADRLRLDLRTVSEGEEEALVTALVEGWEGAEGR